MSKILKKLEGMAGTDSSAIMSNKRPIASTFDKDEAVILKLAQQAFTHIFKQADKADALKPADSENIQAYDEAHLQLGQRRLLCFRIEENTFYICILPQNSDIHKAQKIIRGALAILKKIADTSTVPTP
ncbi:hypothetical protein [Neptunomonas japonica]|uniref:Roadblock/LAMTOR2 domain-containing protein n=1 Tax=Neptunomonas japonica JAMM 1380 TaxID=1441457 RepID=A0A7R6SXE6_9GAMM|nr:hypothetical protein [Neptunomonas japonica]BBB30735.1 hypothetical protein NEJAP_2794 [Neptunomonas japonica JAMM 1380]